MNVSSGLDADALAELFRREYAALRGYVGRRVAADQAEDVVSQVFETAVSTSAKYRSSSGEPRAWLFGIAHNHLRNHRRAEARRLKAYSKARSRAEASSDAAPDFDQVESRLDAARLERTLAAALLALPKAQRDCLLLSAWGDLTPAEIAQIVGAKPGTVRSRLSKARASVRERLETSGQVVDSDESSRRESL